jgi:hypothetical protein
VIAEAVFTALSGDAPVPIKSCIKEIAIVISAFSSPATLSTLFCASSMMLVCWAVCAGEGVVAVLPPPVVPPPVVPPPVVPPPVVSV